MDQSTRASNATPSTPLSALDAQTANTVFAAAFMTNPAAQTVTELATGRILAANQAFYTQMECTPEEAIGHTAVELGMWTEASQRADMVQRLLAAGSLVDYEMHVHTRSGRAMTHLASLVLMELPEGRVIVTTAQDITGRKATEALLRAVNRQNEDALSAAHAAHWEYDVGRSVFIFNPRFYAQHGITDAEGFEMGEEHFTRHYITPEFAAQVGEAVRRALAADANTSFNLDGQLRRTDDSTLWVNTTIWPEKDDAGRTVRLRGFNFDITARKHAEIALRRSEEQVRGLLESLDSVLVTLDADGRLLYVNEVAAGQMGLPPAALVGKTLQDIFPAAVATAQLATIRRVIDQDHSWVAETQSYVYGALRWYRTTYQPIHDERGSVTYVLVNATDIDDIKQAQQQLQESNESLEQRIQERTAELKQALKLRDEFLANMSHELRTPLNTILTLDETLQAGIYGVLTPAQARALGHIATSGRHLLSLINDLLDLSKLDAGRFALDLQPVPADEICRSALGFVTELAAKKQFQLEYADDSLGAVLQADARRLTQVLVNLLDNAIKFTPAGGRVVLHAGLGAGGDTLEFSVRDTGIGISPAGQARIFEPFVQLDGSLARKYEGSGLGLALAKRLAEQHGGTVTVASSGVAGEGALFTVTLPYTPPTAPPPAAPPSERAHQDEAGALAPPAPAAKPRVPLLLAEDNELAVVAMSEYLEFAGYAVTIARTGPEALARATAAPPAIILMDVQLPLLDGLSVIRRLRQDPRLAAVPIIATTALAAREDRDRCLAAGATAYLSKPMRMAELAALIAILLA